MKEGFSWLAFFFSPLYFWYKGMIVLGIMYWAGGSFVVGGISHAIGRAGLGGLGEVLRVIPILLFMLYCGWIFSYIYKEHLISKGYEQVKEDTEKAI